MVDDLGFRSIDLGIDKSIDWTDDELKRLTEVMKKALEFYLEKNMAGNFFSWTFIEKVYQNYYRKEHRKLMWCGAGISSFYICWDGNIFMCPACMDKEYIIGNVECDLGGIWYEEIKRSKDLTEIDNITCHKCAYKKYCPTKGCFVKNHCKNKSIHKPDKLSCIMTKISAGMYETHKTEIDEIMRRRNG